MITYDFYIKQGDTKPTITSDLRNADGIVVLTGATVRFHMIKRGALLPTVDAAATVVDPLTGSVEYVWIAGDTAVLGLYDAEWEVTFSDGKITTFPNTGHISIRIRGELVL